MAGGNNRDFLADPAKYAAAKTILVPAHEAHSSGTGPWANDTDGPFDLSDAGATGFGSDVVVLTTYVRRRKAKSRVSAQIPGIWIAYEPDEARTVNVKATGAGYVVFTSRLGGCAIAIGDRNSASTTFTHDARERGQLPNLGPNALSFRDGDRGYPTGGINVTAFFSWNGSQWNLGYSKPYNALPFNQVIGADNYPKAMTATDSDAEDDSDD